MDITKSRAGRQVVFDPINAVWRFFCSVRLAVVLIIVLAVASLIGVLVQQAPVDISNDPGSYVQWVESMRGRYGFLTDIFRAFGVFDIFNALWFRVAMTLIGLNIIICTLNRFPRYWRSFISPRKRVSDSFFETSRNRAFFRAPNAAEAVEAALKRRRYKVTKIPADGETYLYADRYPWSGLFSFAAHLSMIMIIAGALASNMTGFQRDQIIAEGATAPVYPVRNTNQVQIRLDDFVAEFYEDGRPKDYYSDVVLFQGGREVKRGRVRVNEPLEYQGVRLHQSFYGKAAEIEVRNSEGKILVSETVPLSERFDNVAVGRIPVPTTNYQAVFWMDSNGFGRKAELGVVGLDTTRTSQRSQTAFEISVGEGQSATAKGLEFRFVGQRDFSGLLIRKMTVENLIWIGCGLFVLGFMVSLYFVRHRVWAKITPKEVFMAGVADRFSGLKQELEDLSAEVKAKTHAGKHSGKS